MFDPTDFYKKHYGRLKGYKVVGVEVETDPHGSREPLATLVFQKGKQILLGTVLMDPEGNGPGWIDIWNEGQ